MSVGSIPNPSPRRFRTRQQSARAQVPGVSVVAELIEQPQCVFTSSEGPLPVELVCVAEVDEDAGLRFARERLRQHPLTQVDGGRRAVGNEDELEQKAACPGFQERRPTGPVGDLAEDFLRLRGLACAVQVVRALDDPLSVQRSVRSRGHPQREFGELRCSRWRSSEKRRAGGGLNGGRGSFVPRLHREGDMSSVLLALVDGLGEPAVCSSTLRRRRCLVDRGGVQRMREDDRVSFERCKAGLLGRSEAVSERRL